MFLTGYNIRRGLFSGWLVLVVVNTAVWISLKYSGNDSGAATALSGLSYLLVAWLFWVAGHLRMVGVVDAVHKKNGGDLGFGVTNRSQDDFSTKPTTDDCDDTRWPEELGIAVTAWRAACNNAEKDGKRPGAYIREWVQKAYPGRAEASYDRIAVVANWDKTPGAGKK